MHLNRWSSSWLWIEEMSREKVLMTVDQVSRVEIQRIKLHFRQRFENCREREKNFNFIQKNERKNIVDVLYRRRFPKNDDWLSDDGGGGGIQFASLINASSRRLAAIVENLARVSGVILFMVENARAACSNAGFLWKIYRFPF